MGLPAGNDGLQKPMIVVVDEWDKMDISLQHHDIDSLVTVPGRIRMRNHIQEIAMSDGQDNLLERYTTSELELLIL